MEENVFRKVIYHIGLATIAECIVRRGSLNFSTIILTAAIVLLIDEVINVLRKR